jgi:hypothetical protein
MNEIRMLLSNARRRLEMSSFIAVLHGVAIALAAALLALVVADRAPGEPFVAWVWIVPALCGVSLLAAVMLWSRRRLSELQVALAVDDRLDLREKISTALHCCKRDDAFAQAAVEDAVTTARDPRVRETLRRRFKVVAPRRWWISPLIVAAAMLASFLPQADLFAREETVDEQASHEARQEADETIETIVQTIGDKPQLNAELADLLGDLNKDDRTAQPLEKPEEVKREAIKKVTELNKRLDEIIAGEKGKTAKAVEEMLAKLKAPESGLAKDLAEALQRGDFEAAKQALEKMAQQAQSGDMSQEQKEKLAQQMQQMADHLQQLARQQQQLQQALQQAGLNPQLANNPQALQQAIQNAQNLNQQQKQQLMQMAQAQQQACQMCQGLGAACQQMAQAMQGQGQLGQAGQQMAGQLNQMEQLQMLLRQAQAAANQCQGQCQGLGKGLTMQQALQQWLQGGGMNDWGQGAGGKAPIAPTPFGNKVVKADAPVVPGEIIASTLVDGAPVTGETKAKLKEVNAELAKGYDEAQNEDPLPRRYHETLKHYFGQLRKQVEATLATVPEEEPADTGDAGSGEGGAEEQGGSSAETENEAEAGEDAG